MEMPICSPLPWNVLADPQKLLTTTIITEAESSSWRIFKPFLSNQFNGISGNYWLLLHIQDIRLKKSTRFGFVGAKLPLPISHSHFPFGLVPKQPHPSLVCETVPRLKELQYIDDDCPEEFYHGAIPHWYKLQGISWSAVVDRPAKPVMVTVCPTSRSQVADRFSSWESCVHIGTRLV